MKVPTLPVSAKTGSPQPLPAGTSVPVPPWPVCWAPIGIACPAGHSGRGFWAAWSLTLGTTHGLLPWCSLVHVWYLPLPTLGVEFINILSLLHSLSPFSLPP